LDTINNSIWNNSVYGRTKKKTMKKSQLRELVREAMAKGFALNPETGNLDPHDDDFTSTKLSDLLLQIAKSRPKEKEKYQGDPVRGNKILDRGNPNIPLDEVDGQLYSKDDAIAYIENNRGAKYYNIGVSQGVTQRATDPARAIEIVRDSPISQFKLTTYGQTIQFSAPYDEKHGDAVRAMGGLD
jgi:hypothetical protein